MPIQVCVDESGGKGVTRLYAVVGLISSAESWAAFSEEWSECLTQGRRLSAFKMKEVAKWSEPERTKKLTALVDILCKHLQSVAIAVVDVKLFVRSWGEVMPKGMDNIYVPPFFDIMSAAGLYVMKMGEKEPFEAIFDQQDVYARHAVRAYETYRKTVKGISPELFDLLPIMPIYRRDQDFLPIQAADMIAWCVRNKIENPKDTTFDWILEAIKPKASHDMFTRWDISNLEEKVTSILAGVIEATAPKA